MFNFLNEYKIYIVCALLGLALIFLTYENNLKKEQIKQLNIELNNAILANKSLIKSLDELKKERDKANIAIQNSIIEKRKLDEVVNELKTEIQNDSSDFITKSNTTIDRLWNSTDNNY